MTIPEEFNDIRPYIPEELPGVYDELTADPEFQAIATQVIPGVPFEEIMRKARSCKTSLEFQKAFSYGFMQTVMEKHTTGTDMDASSLDKQRNYTFVSNHRDIVLDSGFLSKLLLDNGFATTVEIAIGNNLFIRPWIKKFVRLNKSFVVKRDLHGRQKLIASKQLSNYIHFAISQKRENIWIAQREGRTKDSNDHTQNSILKMMRLGGEGNVVERLQQLHIVPLSISYEYDPCDYLKAKEFQQKRDNPIFKKSTQDDMTNMRVGIVGYKGHVHYQAASCIDDWLDTLDSSQHKIELYPVISAHIDREIHSNYRLFANNYIAYDMLYKCTRFGQLYSKTEKDEFESYLHTQISKIDLEHPDLDYLEKMILTMYSNPLLNYLKAAETEKEE